MHHPAGVFEGDERTAVPKEQRWIEQLPVVNLPILSRGTAMVIHRVGLSPIPSQTDR